MSNNNKTKVKKVTITKRMTLRDYISVLWMFENPTEYTAGEMIDLSEYNQESLSEEEKYSFRMTLAQKELFDNFFSGYVCGVSLASVLGKLEKNAVIQTQAPSAMVNKIEPVSVALTAPAIPQITGRIVHPGGRIEIPPQTHTPANDYDKLPRMNQRELREIILNDPSEAISIDNFKLPEAIKLVEKGMISNYDIMELFGNPRDGKYHPLWDCRVNSRKDVPEDYKYEPDVIGCILKAEMAGESYLSIMTAPEPTEEQIIEVYSNYIVNNAPKSKNQELVDAVVMSEQLLSCEKDTLKLCTDNKDPQEYEEFEVKYKNAEDMKWDLLYLMNDYRIKVDKTATFDIFGKKFTLEKIAKELYKKYPEGLPNKHPFYKSARAQYIAEGKA